MTNITLADILEDTDLAETLAPTPKLAKLLTEPTIFDLRTLPERPSAEQRPKRPRFNTLREDVLGDDLEQEVGFPTAEQELTDEPMDPERYGGFGQDRPDGYRDSHFAGSLYANHRDTPSLLPLAPVGQEWSFDAERNVMDDPDTIRKWNITKGDQTTEELATEAEKKHYLQSWKTAEGRITETEITDDERRRIAAEAFGIDPDTMTDENLEGLS